LPHPARAEDGKKTRRRQCPDRPRTPPLSRGIVLSPGGAKVLPPLTLLARRDRVPALVHPTETSISSRSQRGCHSQPARGEDEVRQSRRGDPARNVRTRRDSGELPGLAQQALAGCDKFKKSPCCFRVFRPLHKSDPIRHEGSPGGRNNVAEGITVSFGSGS